MDDLISRQAAIDEIEYELEMINSALDSITLDFNARERLRQRRGEAREILNSIQQLPSAQPEKEEIIRCKDCAYQVESWIGMKYCEAHGDHIGGDYDYCSNARRKENG